MRRWVIMIGVVLAAGLVGCSDDNGGSAAVPTETPSTAPVEGTLIDEAAAEERLEAVCRRSVPEALRDDCLAAATVAVADATEAGCPATSLDAWAEHIVASRFATTPHAEFFARCPLPLSNLLLSAAPSPYQRVTAQQGTGLLNSASVAAGYVASADVERFLGDVGHQVSYAAAWADGDHVVLVRLDRFESPDQAEAFLESEHRTLGQFDSGAGETRQIPGILQGRVVASDSQHLATGRVCEVAMSLVAQDAGGGGLSTDEVVSWFSDQARRLQTVVTC